MLAESYVKLDNLNMSELADSIAESIRKRVVSASLGTYLFFWCVFHWQGLYTTLFVDQQLILDKTGLLKNDYVSQSFFSWHGWETLLGYVGPLALTVLFIWPIPKYILIHAYRQEQRHKIDRRRVKIEEEEKLEIKKEKLAIQTQKTLEAEIDVAKVEKRAVSQDPTILWRKEYDALQKSGLVTILPDIAESVYKGGGRVMKHFDKDIGEWVGANLSKDSIAIAHTNDLITIKDERISLTEKGKYFLSQSYLK
jgi:hypothetical protein